MDAPGLSPTGLSPTELSAPELSKAELSEAGPSETDDLSGAGWRLIEPPKQRRSTIWVPLAVAAALHIAPFLATALGVVPSVSMRRMGEADGDPDAITVDVVDAATLASSSPPPVQPPPQPAPEPAPQPPQPPQAQPPQAPQAQPTPPIPEIRGTTAPESPPDEPLPKQPPRETPPAKQPAAKAPPPPPPLPAPPPPQRPNPGVEEMVKEMTELFAPEPRRQAPPAKRPNEQQPPPANEPPREPSTVEPSTRELDKPIEFQANSSSVARPVDITRSGENDEFGRGVIRALRQTMPPPWGLRSRVTIMFLLSPSGQVAEMQLVKGSGYPLVDQSVVFAARNSTFPMPAKGSKVSDRIFLVTYLYD